MQPEVVLAAYRGDLRQRIDPVWREIDMLLVPTSGTIYRIDEVEAEPIALNSNLGLYTNFVNLMDLCGIAVPNGFRADGMPLGVTILAPAFAEARAAAIASAFQRATGSGLGALRIPHPT